MDNWGPIHRVIVHMDSPRLQKANKRNKQDTRAGEKVHTCFSNRSIKSNESLFLFSSPPLMTLPNSSWRLLGRFHRKRRTCIANVGAKTDFLTPSAWCLVGIPIRRSQGMLVLKLLKNRVQINKYRVKSGDQMLTALTCVCGLLLFFEMCWPQL